MSADASHRPSGSLSKIRITRAAKVRMFMHPIVRISGHAACKIAGTLVLNSHIASEAGNEISAQRSPGFLYTIPS